MGWKGRKEGRGERELRTLIRFSYLLACTVEMD